MELNATETLSNKIIITGNFHKKCIYVSYDNKKKYYKVKYNTLNLPIKNYFKNYRIKINKSNICYADSLIPTIIDVKGIKLVPVTIIVDNKQITIYEIVYIQPISSNTGIQIILNNEISITNLNIELYILDSNNKKYIINNFYNIIYENNLIYINSFITQKFHILPNKVYLKIKIPKTKNKGLTNTYDIEYEDIC